MIEACYDELDNDCNPATSDCDCDGDGQDAVECAGQDCDDSARSVYEGAPELLDGEDNDCDEVADEDLYCNSYFPLENGAAPIRVYTSAQQDGTVFTETVVITSFSTVTGDAVFTRTLDNGAGLAFDVVESRSCVDGVITIDGWDVSAGGFALSTISYSSPRT
ncbi:MAG: putative metal-binding motif-containing protein, partial [bacterium]